jgi:hypothetical protein
MEAIMASVKIVYIDYSGDDAGVMQVIGTAMRMMADGHEAEGGNPATARSHEVAADAAFDSALPAAAEATERAELPAPKAAEPAAPPASVPLFEPEPQSRRPSRRAFVPSPAKRFGPAPTMVYCTERPGEKFTLKQAAELAKVSVSTIYSMMTLKGRHKADRYGLHFYRDGESAPVYASVPYETRPRSSGESMPINPFRRGGNAPVPQDPIPTTMLGSR